MISRRMYTGDKANKKDMAMAVDDLTDTGICDRLEKRMAREIETTIV